MTVIDPVMFSGEQQFLTDINKAIKAAPDEDDSILLFVHGYNTTFTDAVLRLGQFVEDSGFDGVPVLFSWASASKLTDYVYDLNSALSARSALIEGSDVLIKSNARSINLVAHSMGNFLSVEAMKQARIQNRFDSSGKVKNIILASPDIDVDVFAEQMSVFEPSERKFYVLISEDDKALSFSRFLARGINRVGDADVEQLDALGVTVIDLTQVDDTSSTNHTKFADSPEVVRIIGGEVLKGDSLHTAPTDPSILGNIFLEMTNATQSALNPGG
jgi:esterase/lipase superfamily enzyme